MTLRRSARLARAFWKEQTNPGPFYELAAQDAVAQVSRFADLNASLVVDVGTGPRQFAEAFERAGATFVGVDLTRPSSGLVANGERLPLRSGSVDVVFCSNVLEHWPSPWAIGDELVRVCRPGGAVVLSFTVWLSPWGGHETAPWHYLGGERAARRFADKHGRNPKNYFGSTLFPVSVKDALRWAGTVPDAALRYVGPRYYPDWMRWLVRVPALRELATWNLFMVLGKAGTRPNCHQTDELTHPDFSQRHWYFRRRSHSQEGT